MPRHSVAIHCQWSVGLYASAIGMRDAYVTDAWSWNVGRRMIGFFGAAAVDKVEEEGKSEDVIGAGEAGFLDESGVVEPVWSGVLASSSFKGVEEGGEEGTGVVM